MELGTLSTDELMAMRAKKQGATPPPAASARPLSEIPTEELLSVRSGLNPQDGAQGVADANTAAARRMQRGVKTGVRGADLSADDWGRQFAKGVPVIGGLLDNANAATYATLSPLFPGDTTVSQAPDWRARYDENLKREQTRDAAFERGNPWTSTGLNIAGGVAGTVPLALTNLGARGLGLVGNTLARVVQGGSGGAALAGADALTRGDDVMKGAGVGGTLGATFPVVGRGAGAIASALSRQPTPPAIGAFSPNALDKVGRAIGDDAVTRQSFARLGPEAMLLDAGPNLRLQGEALATQPGAANRLVGDAVTGRHQQAPARITDSVDNTLGPYRSFREHQNTAIEARRVAGNTNYQQAFRQAGPVDTSGALQYIDDIVPEHLARTGAPDPNSIEAALLAVRNRLAGDAGRRVDARSLHTLKLDLDDQIDAAVRAGRNNQARVLTDVRNRVVTGLDDATGGANGLYAQARQQFRSESAVIRAMDDGRSIFNRTTRPDELLAQVRDMSDAERQAFRLGSRDAIDEVMGNATNDALAARNLLSKDWNRQKLTALVGRDQAEQLFSIIERENAFAQTYGAIERGSQTRGRQAAGREFPNAIDWQLPARGGDRTVLGTIEQAGRKVVNALGDDFVRGRAQATNNDAARMLTARGGRRDAILEGILARQAEAQRLAPIRAATQDVVTALSQGAAIEPRRYLQGTR